MLAIRETDRKLSIIYKPLVLVVLGGSSIALGLIILAVSRALAGWISAGALCLIGVALVALYIKGSRLEIDGTRGTFRHGKTVRGSLSEIASVEVRRGSIIATRKKTGAEARLLHTILARSKESPPELHAVADRIRAYLT